MAYTLAQIDADIETLTRTLANPRARVTIGGETVQYVSVSEKKEALKALRQLRAEMAGSAGLGIRIVPIASPNANGIFPGGRCQ